MPLWPAHAASTKLGIYFPSQPVERCELGRISAYRTETVSHPPSSSQWPCSALTDSGHLSAVGALSSRSKLVRDDIKWQELLQHFRSVQSRHEKARRQALGTDTSSFAGFYEFDRQSDQGDKTNRATPARPGLRRKATNDIPVASSNTSSASAPQLPSTPFSPRAGALSPLNPRARIGNNTGTGPSHTTNPAAILTQQVQKQKRTISLSRKE